MYELSALGFGPFFAQQLSNHEVPSHEVIVARIAAEHRSAYEVFSEAGVGPARLTGRLAHELGAEAFPGVGDWVTLQSAPAPEQVCLIDSVLERRTVFTRGAAGRAAQGQVIAANVDVVLVVCGLDADFSLRRLERYLARVWASGAQPVIVLSKVDLCGDAVAKVERVEQRNPGVLTLATCALEQGQQGLEPLAQLVRPGVTVAVVGSSGAGKSTLINALSGEPQLATGEVRASDGRGQHTTTHRQLIVLPEGGLLIDTPGMRELQLLDADGLESVFADIGALATRCRYRDCRHLSEPGCAVREAVEEGDLPADRLEHFEELEREAAAYESRRDAPQRRKAGRVMRQMVREAQRLRRWKRGE